VNFKFLPLPLYIAFFTSLFCLMVFIAISRRKKDRKELIVLYITLSALAPLIIIERVIPAYNNITFVILALLVLAIFLECTVIAIIDYKKGKQNKQTLIGLIMGWAGIIFFLLIMLKVI